MNKKLIRICAIVCMILIIVGILFIPKLLWKYNKKAQQISVDTVLSTEEMIEDLYQLEKYITQVHPSTAHGISEDVNNSITTVFETITKPMTVCEFYFLLNKIVCELQDAHTCLGISGYSKMINLPVQYIEDEIVVTRKSGELKPGDLIIKLGEKQIDDCINFVKDNIPSENIYWKNKLSAHYLKREIYLENLGLVKNDKVVVTYERNGEALQTTLSLEEIAMDKNQSFVKYQVDSDAKIGIVTINQCVYNEEYKNILSEAFSEMASSDIDTLVIDVRKNTGGTSRCFDELISYIDIDKYNGYTGWIRGSWDAWIQRNAMISHNIGNGVKENNKKDTDLLFNGNIIVLVSGYTFSSGNWFGVVLQDNNLATVIGEPTGNKPTSYGDVLSFTLKNSGINLQMSYKVWNRPNSEKDDLISLFPDITIEKSIEAIKNDSDVVMEYVIENYH